MPELILPDARVRESFLDAMREVIAEGSRSEAAFMGSEQTRYGAAWHRPDGFEAYVAEVRADAQEATPRRPNFVPQTTWWWVEDDEYLGRISVRHRLTDFLLEVGGHIGYYVRPSRRRLGHATGMLRAVLPHAAAMGIDRALVTCDDSNLGSRRVIEAAGGELEDQRGVKLRYWVPTG
jgi:predicted acetyltransferase